MKVSLYKDTFDKTGVQIDHLKILEGIRDGKWQSKIQQLLAFEKKSEDFERIKKSLPAACFSGVFSNREDNKLVSMSSLMVVDIDNVTPDQIAKYKDSFKEDEYMHAAFVSPSGAGIKALVVIDDIDPEDFIPMFIQIEKYFKERYAIKIDPSGKNISRLCYVSYDPDTYINPTTAVFKLDKAAAEEFKKGTIANFDSRPEKYRGHVVNKDAKYSFKICEKWTQRNHEYVEGNRNNYIHVLACNLNRAGVDIHDTAVMIYSNYSDLPMSEIETTVQSAYKRKSEHGIVDIYKTPEDQLPDHTEDLGLNADEEAIYKDTTHLLERDVDKKIVNKLVKNFGTSFLSIEESRVKELMLLALNDYRNASQKNAIDYFDIESAVKSVMASPSTLKGISTGVPEFDEVLKGGLKKGMFVGLIGNGGAGKSLFGQILCSNSTDEPALYLCGEMSLGQLMPRIIEEHMGISNMADVTEDVMKQFIEKMKGKLYIITSSGWTEEGIFATIEKIREETGKNVGIVVIDGLSQMADVKNDEIKSAIHNSERCKNIAKHANGGEGTVVVALLHLSSGPVDHFRNTDKHVRGGTKIINNMDAFFCHSKIIDEEESNIDNDDIFYRNDMFYLRLKDKRGSGLIVNKVIKIQRPTKLVPLDIDPAQFEVKME